MKTLTVLTPTFNRRRLLERAYESLVAQTCGDFVWMIVDDGSTDGTQDAVSSFIAEGKVEIEYIKKENGGKHTAVNEALSRLETELVVLCLDSDDEFLPDAVERITAAYFGCDKKYAGYVFMNGGRFSRFDDGLTGTSWRDAVTEGRFDGESVIVLKSEYAKRFRFPVFEGEKFCTEGIVWLRMTEPFFWSRESVCRGEYYEDGYSNNMLSLFAKNPRSFRAYNDLRLSIWKGFLKRLKFAAYYDGFSMLAGERGFIRSSSRPALCAAALPAGFVFYLILKLKK